MKLSSPIYRLKSKAKAIKKSKSISMSEALNEVAQAEGYSSWSLLRAKSNEIYPKSEQQILDFLNPGDLMIIAARPGLGKTKKSLELALQAAAKRRRCHFFSLESSRKGLASQVATLDQRVGQFSPYLVFDFSDDISSDYIISKVEQHIGEGDLLVVDYLQLLDQKRSNPSLQQQVMKLKAFAQSKGCIIVFLSQVDRSFEDSGRERPTLDDLRLPNPLELSLINKCLFLHAGKAYFVSPTFFEIKS